MKLFKRTYILASVLAVISSWSACSSDGLTLPEQEQPSAEDMIGEVVQFETQVTSDKTDGTRAASYTVDDDLLQKYAAIRGFEYKLTVSRYSRPIGSIGEGELDGVRYFLPKTTKVGTNVTYDSEGTLVLEDQTPAQTPFYWDSNAKEYAFMAVAGSETIDLDQTTREQMLLQDRLEGYAYVPLKDGVTPIDHLDAPNFRTSKQWYAMNKAWYEQNGIAKSEDLKKIPLFLQHKRAWVTVILKAGEGMDRANLDYATADRRIKAKIFDWQDASTKNDVNPWLDKFTMVYEATTQSAEETRDVARYDAIVSPYNFLTNPEDDKICEVSVSGQRFTFGASNDDHYLAFKEGDAEAIEKMQIYNLKPGQHLVIAATLSRESRKILITAYVADWTEEIISYICDDYGSNGDPTVINNRDELLAFLQNTEKNVAGNVAIIGTAGFDLEKTKDGEAADWPEELVLNSTLNMGGATLTTAHPFLRSVSGTGNIINGRFSVAKNEEVASAVCLENLGSINRVTVVGEEGTVDSDVDGHVTRASIAVTNQGTITMCTSEINVIGKSVAGSGRTYIGGIAAESLCQDESTLAAIEDCVVYGRVGIADNQTSVFGGGIVGLADGNVDRNTYEYGVTLLQNPSGSPVLRNIIYDKNETYNLNAYENAWPTSVKNEIGNHSSQNANSRDVSELFDFVIDSQKELAELVKEGSSFNQSDKRYRIANSFEVVCFDTDLDSETGWPNHPESNWPMLGNGDGATNADFGNVLFDLDGNNQTITLKGNRTLHYKEKKDSKTDIIELKSAPMLFHNIMGSVQNLDIYCANDLYGLPVYSTDSPYGNQSLDVCAPLGYNLNGGTLRNVRVYGAEGTKVQSAIASGLVVWAFNGAVIEKCISMMDVELYYSGTFGSEARRYGGGLVAEAADVTISMCSYVPPANVSVLSTNNTSNNIFIGGIVGGVAMKDVTGTKYNPALILTDCSSWFSWQEDSQNHNSRGGIIGRCGYLPDGQGAQTIGLLTSQCSGNWWNDGTAGVGEHFSIYSTDAKVIGAKNSVIPSQPIIEE